MIQNRYKFFALLTAILVIPTIILPVSAEAKVVVKKKVTSIKATAKKTSKAVVKAALSDVIEETADIIEPASKCVTKKVRDLNEKAEKQLKIDVTKFGEGHEKSVENYRYRLGMAWDAMNLPYCGFGGASSLTDEVHSFKKSIDRARADFLKETKKK
ncbi:hypothetical protein HZC53_03620 [Candidatus Uhrbacteria bacterium]|nr:hypothetical protein [Candidatus Uhrbacteria bacterium]